MPSARPPAVTLAPAHPVPQPHQAEVAAKLPGNALPGDEQKQQIASEAADLLKMATALKSEVDRTTKDQLSVSVVRKAGAIEQLAHKVRFGTVTGKG
jgi:hypothetical protein